MNKYVIVAYPSKLMVMSGSSPLFIYWFGKLYSEHEMHLFKCWSNLDNPWVFDYPPEWEYKELQNQFRDYTFGTKPISDFLK